MAHLGRSLSDVPRTAVLGVLGTLLAGTLSAPGASPSAAQSAPAASSASASAAGAGVAERPRAVIGKRVIGRSVRGRPIVAYHLGEPEKRRVPTVVLISAMHGNELAPRQILWSLMDGPKVRGIDLWVVPTYNPDGAARHTRRNARGVDLNRNYPYNWAPLDGNYESGPRPQSEPETRAMMGFLRKVRPDHILSFHQPLNGVDTDTKDRRFAIRVARMLDLPRKRFDCGGVCHGTMTSWYNRNFGGNALTVEYGARPSRHRMKRVAPDQVLAIFGAWRGPRPDRG